jgi:2-phosphosulfolactate phosphatase
MSSALDQSRYQVRLEWGAAGLARLAASDVVVIVDALGFSTAVTDRIAAGESVSLATAVDLKPDAGALVTRRADATGAVVLLGCFRNAAAVAAAALAEQARRGARTSVAVIAAGEFAGASERDPAHLIGDAGASPLRFAVEDHLAAGAIVDALGALGIDHTSPEAAAAGESFRGLRGALRHLLSASGTGQQLTRTDLAAVVLHAAQIDATASVPVLRDGVFLDVSAESSPPVASRA